MGTAELESLSDGSSGSNHGEEDGGEMYVDC